MRPSRRGCRQAYGSSKGSQVIGGGKQTAVEVDTETAVRIRNKRSGELQLVTNAGLFFPKAEEEILEVQKLVKLADYECMMIKNASGELERWKDDTERQTRKLQALNLKRTQTHKRINKTNKN